VTILRYRGRARTDRHMPLVFHTQHGQVILLPSATAVPGELPTVHELPCNGDNFRQSSENDDREDFHVLSCEVAWELMFHCTQSLYTHVDAARKQGTGSRRLPSHSLFENKEAALREQASHR
jgi:hypothetical protein